MNELLKINRLILASASPRRQELIAALELSVPVMMVPSSVDEYVPEDWTPIEIVEQLSIRKAEAVGKTFLNHEKVFRSADGNSNLAQLVIGSDTIVVQDGEVFGKPADEQHAVKMLQSLQGRTHEVYTGLACAVFPIELEGQTNESDGRESIIASALLSGEKLGQTGEYRAELSSADKLSADAQFRYVGHTCNKVTFREMSDREINSYVASGYPMDKAGGYDTTMHLGDIGQYRIISESPDGRPEIIVGHTVSKVTFRPMSDEEIWAYVKTGDPLDKAGAYGVQGIGSVFIEKIEGDFYSIMGLPLNLLYQMLLMFGISLFNQS